MGNTCYVVATVTVADWRMIVGFRALLMAICRRPSPSRSLIPQARDLRSGFYPSFLAPFGIGCSPFSLRIPSRRIALRRRTLPPPNYLRNLVFRALILSTSPRDADRKRDFISGTHREDRFVTAWLRFAI